MVEMGQCEDMSVPPLLRERPVTAGCSGSCLDETDCVQGQKLHNFSVQPVSVFNHLHSKTSVFSCLSRVSYVSAMFQLVPVACRHARGHHREETGSILMRFLYTCLRCF